MTTEDAFSGGTLHLVGNREVVGVYVEHGDDVVLVMDHRYDV
jgi:hypothetical protein